MINRFTSRLNTMGRAYWNYIKRKESLPYQPFKMWIEATNHCNLACRMCPNSQKPAGYKQGYMEMALYRDIVDQIRGRASHVNLHHRGESLLHKELPEMISLAKNAGIKTSIHTNATLLNGELSREIISSGLDFLSFSFDGYDKQSYEAKRIGAVFETTTQNIRDFLSMKSRLKSTSPFTVMEFIDFGYNPGEIEALLKFAKSLDCPQLDQILIKKEHNWAGSHRTESCGKKHSYTACTFPYYALVILFDGTVVPCPQDFFGELALGNLKDQSLAQIWNNSNMLRLRRLFRHRDIDSLSPCSKCDLIRRNTLMGIPVSDISGFMKENLLGFRKMPRSNKITFK